MDVHSFTSSNAQKDTPRCLTKRTEGREELRALDYVVWTEQTLSWVSGGCVTVRSNVLIVLAAAARRRGSGLWENAAGGRSLYLPYESPARSAPVDLETLLNRYWAASTILRPETHASRQRQCWLQQTIRTNFLQWFFPRVTLDDVKRCQPSARSPRIKTPTENRKILPKSSWSFFFQIVDVLADPSIIVAWNKKRNLRSSCAVRSIEEISGHVDVTAMTGETW